MTNEPHAKGRLRGGYHISSFGVYLCLKSAHLGCTSVGLFPVLLSASLNSSIFCLICLLTLSFFILFLIIFNK